jgi:lysophospholipase L1-like esterase
MTFQIDPESRLGIEGSRHFHVNSRGLRADELGPEHEVRVLAFGGSTTECLILDQKEAWPHLVQEILGGPPGSRPVWVGNAGVSGRGSREHVFQVPRLLASYPETDVALVLVGVNDLGMRLQQDDEYDPRFLERENVEDEMIPRAFAHYPLEFRSSLPYHKRLELYARLRHLKNYVMMVLPDRGEVQNASGSNIARWRENRRNATRIRMQLPDLAESLAEYRRNLMRIAASAREAGVPLVFITQPSLWRSDLPDEERALLWWGGVGEFMAEGARTEFYSVEALAEGMHRYNRVLLSVCQESGAHCLDLASLLPKDTTVFYDGVHFHEAGARRVAALVSECVAEVLEAPAEAGVCGAARY